jgi:hypothetical protein
MGKTKTNTSKKTATTQLNVKGSALSTGSRFEGIKAQDVEWYDFSDTPWELVANTNDKKTCELGNILTKAQLKELTLLGCQVSGNRVSCSPKYKLAVERILRADFDALNARSAVDLVRGGKNAQWLDFSDDPWILVYNPNERNHVYVARNNLTKNQLTVLTKIGCKFLSDKIVCDPANVSVVEKILKNK